MGELPALVRKWLRIQDSNLECLIQSQVCCRYTNPQQTDTIIPQETPASRPNARSQHLDAWAGLV